MIHKKCVFIVGAGASADLGLPAGQQLKQKVRSATERRSERGAAGQLTHFGFPPSEVGAALEKSPQDRDDPDRVGKALDKIAANMATASSVDAFLENHRDDALMVRIGKYAIADTIANAEVMAGLDHEKYDSFEPKELSKAYFLNEILNLAVAGHTIADVNASLSNLHFITFNYDRCIERYADLWLRNRFGEKAGERAFNINVLHVFGSLGEYVPGPQFSVGTLKSPHSIWQNPHIDLPKVANRLRIFNELTDQKIQNDINAACADAEVVIFAGFAFDPENMSFFKEETWNATPSKDRKTSVYATTLGIQPPGVQIIKEIIAARFPKDSLQRIATVDGKFTQLWMNHNVGIRQAAGAYV